MIGYKSYKFRIYPTKEQETILANFFGAKRWIFNHFLSENKQRFENNQPAILGYNISNQITKLKKEPETAWLKDIDDWCLKHAAEDLSNAYKNFFNSITGKRKGPKVSFPVFKNKNSRQSYRTRGVSVDFESGVVKLPKIKNVKCVFDRQFEGKIKYVTVSKNPSGRYYVSILVEEEIHKKQFTGKEIGIDLGLKDLCVLSNGLKLENTEEMLSRAKTTLKRQQKKLSRKTKGSKNYQEQKLKVARCYEKVTDKRNWYYHNISSYLVGNFDSIYMEDLNVKGMIKNKKLSRRIHESAWSTLVGMIEYKCSWYGKTFHKIGRFVPSSKTCSCCGYKLESLPLSVREWKCPSCGVFHDRDLNAAINIKRVGQTDCYDQPLNSEEPSELADMPKSLQKFTTKIERSDSYNLLVKGAGKSL